jgi:hypothetical protein
VSFFASRGEDVVFVWSVRVRDREVVAPRLVKVPCLEGRLGSGLAGDGLAVGEVGLPRADAHGGTDALASVDDGDLGIVADLGGSGDGG